MASRRAKLLRRPASPREASVKATEAFDDPTSAKIGGLRFRDQAIKRCHQNRRGRQERSARSQAGPGLVSLLLRARAAPRDALPRSIKPVSASRRNTAFAARAGQNQPKPWPRAPAPRPASTAARHAAAARGRRRVGGRRRAAARRAAARAGRRRAARSATARASASRARPAAGTTAASGSSSRRVLPRPVFKRGCSSVAERPLCMRKAQGSNPCSSTNTHPTPWRNG